MKISFDKAFYKSLSKLKTPLVANQIERMIAIIQASRSIRDIPQIKKLQGFTDYYRIRLGDFRLGIELEDNESVRFIIIAHRKDIYKYFP